jgi:hypothetical protein
MRWRVVIIMFNVILEGKGNTHSVVDYSFQADSMRNSKAASLFQQGSIHDSRLLS